jgi:peptidoglycan/xylan/chitin deacetylase (PgdA/CDA1 family)
LDLSLIIPQLGFKRLARSTILEMLIRGRSVMPEFSIRYLLALINIGYRPIDHLDGKQAFVTPYRGGMKAACCISVDFDHPFQYPGKAALNPIGTQALLELSEKYSVPITWAICGNITLKDRGAYQRILHSKVEQEIGVHTYTHRDFTDPTCSDEEAEEEIRKCIDVLGIQNRPTTFVFPWNRESKYHIVTNEGFTAYRSKIRELGYPLKEHGLWKIPGVYYLDEKSFGAEGLVKKYIDLAIAYGSVLHLWTHPWSISADGDVEAYAKRTLEPIFQHLAKRRDDGQMWICTMKELANYCELRERFEILNYQTDAKGLSFQVRATAQFPSKMNDLLTIEVPTNSSPHDMSVESEDLTENVRFKVHNANGDKIFLELPVRHSLYSVKGVQKVAVPSPSTMTQPLLNRSGN